MAISRNHLAKVLESMRLLVSPAPSLPACANFPGEAASRVLECEEIWQEIAWPAPDFGATLVDVVVSMDEQVDKIDIDAGAVDGRRQGQCLGDGLEMHREGDAAGGTSRRKP